MSRWLVAALVVGLFVAGATPFAQNDVSGAWELTINGPQGSINADATLTQAGDKLTGTLTSPQGEVAIAGTIKGAMLELAFTVETSQGALDIRMSAEVSGTSMKGVLDFGQGTAEFTGSRK